jgi:hypothetical protein
MVKLVDASRAAFNGVVSDESLQTLVDNPKVEVLQTADPQDDKVWRKLNERFFAQRSDVELRIYGHYSTVCDLNFARLMTNVRRFSADCLTKAKNVEAIGEMPKLESLHLGIFELKDFDVLELVPATLTELTLGATRSKKPQLQSLSRFQDLRVLYIEGHDKGIECIGELHQLEDLTLRSIAIENLHYLTPLEKLWSLDVKLGSVRSFAGIEGKSSLKYLELWQVRELKDIDIISTLTGLQYLFLQSLPHIETVPSLINLKSLRRLVFDNLKGLRDFTALEFAPALDEFALLDGKKQLPEQVMPALRNPGLGHVCGFFGSDKKNKEFLGLCEAHGKATWDPREPFQFA